LPWSNLRILVCHLSKQIKDTQRVMSVYIIIMLTCTQKILDLHSNYHHSSHGFVSLHFVWRTNKKGDVLIYIYYKNVRLSGTLYISLDDLTYFPGADYNICKLLYLYLIVLLIMTSGIDHYMYLSPKQSIMFL